MMCSEISYPQTSAQSAMHPLCLEMWWLPSSQPREELHSHLASDGDAYLSGTSRVRWFAVRDQGLDVQVLKCLLHTPKPAARGRVTGVTGIPRHKASLLSLGADQLLMSICSPHCASCWPESSLSSQSLEHLPHRRQRGSLPTHSALSWSPPRLMPLWASPCNHLKAPSTRPNEFGLDLVGNRSVVDVLR